MIRLAAPYNQAQRAIVLPSPEFSDSQSSMIELKRQMGLDGTTYTYVRNKNRRKLKFNLQLPILKAKELQDFLILYSAHYMRLRTHDDEVWKVQLTNEPLDFETVIGGDYYKVELEFQGVRVHAPEFDC